MQGKKRILSVLLVGAVLLLGASSVRAYTCPELTDFQYQDTSFNWHSAVSIYYNGTCGTNCEEWHAVFWTTGDDPNTGGRFRGFFDWYSNGFFYDASMYRDGVNDVYSYYTKNGDEWVLYSRGRTDIDWESGDEVIDFTGLYRSLKRTRVYVDIIVP